MTILFTILTLILFLRQANGQDAGFVDLIFRNPNELEFTVTVGQETRSRFFLLSQASAWSPDRFILHHNSARGLDTSAMLYLFTDSALNALISDNEKRHLMNQAMALVPRKVTNTYKTIKLADTLHKPNNSYIYQLTEPIYTLDSTYAFIDAAIYFPNEADISFHQAYEAQMFFIFKRSNNSKWELIRKKVTMFLL